MKKATFLCTLAALAGFLLQPAIGQAADNSGTSTSAKSLEERVTQLEKDLFSLDAGMQMRVPRNVAVLNPTKTSLAVMTDGSGIIAVGIDDLKPYGDGSEILLSVINFLGVTLNDVELTAFVITKQKPTADPYTKKEVSIRSIRSGTEQLVKVRIPGITPSEINFLNVYYSSTGGFSFNTENNN